MSSQRTSARAGDPSHRSPLRRTDALLGGIVWWGCHLGGSYWLVPRSCALGTSWPLHLLTVVLLALIARAWLSGLQLQRAGRASTGRDAERDVYLGWSGMALSVFFAGVVVAEWVPSLLLDPCW